jgi:L-lactate dehydrogenase complex protein LldG
MQEATSKEKVLKKVRKALIQKTKNPYPNLDYDSKIYSASDESLDILFAEEFTKVSGQFVYCENGEEFIQLISSLTKEREWNNFHAVDKQIMDYLDKGNIKYTNDEAGLLNSEVGITLCEFLSARTGSIIISSKQLSGRRLSVFPPVHIVVAYSSQLVFDIKDALSGIKNKYGENIPSMISAITGPSRSADIEKTLVMGAHGPKEVFVFLIDDTINN